MASTFTTLGIEKMATGENAGTWGTKTNTNLDIINTAVSGYVEQAVTSGGTLALSITDGASTATAQNAVIKLTGTITGNSIVTVPDSVEKVYIVTNGTSGAYTVQFKTASGTGITFGVSEKTTRLVYSDGTNIVDAGFGGALDIEGRELVLDADGDTTITADTDDQIDIKIAGADDFQFTANTFTAQSGSSIVVPDGGLTFGSTAISSTAAELNILDGVTSTAAELNILDGVTSTAAELNVLDGITAVVGELNALDIGSTAVGTAVASKAVILDSNKDYTGIRNLTLTGDLTVGGDDITMGTNTAGNLLVADGTNFNSIAVGSLSAISTVAADDVLLAVDTSGGGLKKITRSALVSGLAAGELSNIVEDTSPQLGANLDTNSHNILIDDAHFIGDENGNEQIIFQTTSSAVNQFDVTNAATGNPPSIQATGGDSNIDFNLGAKGTGHVTILGNSNPGTIQLNCEQNSHGVQIKSPAHSAASSAVLTLPTATGNLIGSGDTGTLPVAAIDIDGATDIGAGIADADLFIVDDGAGGTNRKVTASRIKTYIGSGVAADDISVGDAAVTLSTSSGDITIDATANDSDIIFKGTDATADITMLTLDGSDAGTATFNHDIILGNDSFIQFGGASETISGDGTDMTIAANNLTIDAAADIILDAAGNDFNFKAGGTEVLRITNSSSDVIIRPVVDAKDIIFQQRDGTEVARIEDNATFNVSSAGKFAYAGTAVTSTAAELNILDGVTATAAELNYSDLATLGTSAASKVLSADSNNLTKITGAIFIEEATLSFDATQDWDVRASPVAKVTLTNNVTFDAPTNPTTGQFISIVCIQDGTGSRTIAWNAVFEFASDTAPTATTTASKADMFNFRYNGSKWLEVGRNLALTVS